MVGRRALAAVVLTVTFLAVLFGLHYMRVHNKPMRDGMTCFATKFERAPPGYSRQRLQNLGIVAVDRDGRVFIEICVF